MLNGRNGTLSPVSPDSAEWSPVTRYQTLGGENPYSPVPPPAQRGITPPTSLHSSINPVDGPMPGGMPRPNGNPSPPSSIGRSSDGTGLYASNMSDAGMGPRRLPAPEETLSEHFRVLKAYLGPFLRDEKGNPRPSRAKDKLTRLSTVQFQELSTDVYDESIRREVDLKRGGPKAPGNDTPKYLLPKNTFHPKRNQARMKLSTLPLDRFRQLATDVFYELGRRYPQFLNGDMPRPASPAGSMASGASTNRGPPSRMGTPNSMNGGMRGGRPSFSSMRNGPPGPPGPQGPPGIPRPGAPNELGRPLPKTFQQNTIVPDKGTMVEDDDSGADEEDAFNLEGAAARRQTNKSMKGINDAQEKIVSDLQNQVVELQSQMEVLEGSLQEKEKELQDVKNTRNMQDGSVASERAEWQQLRSSLEEKLHMAENLNSSLRTEIQKLQLDNQEVEQTLRAQIADLEVRPLPVAPVEEGGEWKQRCQSLESALNEQQQVTEEVRQDAQKFLEEMRQLSAQTDAAIAKEDRLTKQVSLLDTELKEWKARYARTRTQLRSLKASSVGLSASASPDISLCIRDCNWTAMNGAVKDVHVTKFQLSIDELLQVARRSSPDDILSSMRHVVNCVRAITGDIDSTPLSQLHSPSSSVNGDGAASPDKQQAKLKSRVSATANNLITASKNHASSGGLAPVSLLDAACSHLSTAVVELLKAVKVRPTPEHELDRGEDADRAMPLRSSGPLAHNSANINGLSTITTDLSHQRHRSRGSGSTRYSAYSSPYSAIDRQSAGPNGIGYGADMGMTQFKNYLEDQTALLVQSIQPLVNLIRAAPSSTSSDDKQLYRYIQEISQAVEDTANRTYGAVKELSDPALKKHALPVVEVLEECRRDLIAVDVQNGGRERIPPLAFKTARALKELVLRVDRIETGEVTVDSTLKNDF